MKISKNHIIWNYFGTILNQGLNIFILPIVVKLLIPSELGLWYVFGSIAALANLVDFGFSPTIMRNISYAFGGARNLLEKGISKEDSIGKPNIYLINVLINASKKIYFGLSIIALTILLSIGTIYIKSILGHNYLIYKNAWFIYVLAIFVNLYYSYWTPILKGIGGIKEVNQAIIISRVFYLITAFFTLYAKLGLLGLSIAYMLSGLLLRLISKYYFLKINGKAGKTNQDSVGVTKILTIIWPNAKKSGIVTIGAWLISRSTTLLCSTFLGLEETARFGLSMQLITFILTFSTLMFNSYIPELAYLEVNQNKDRYKIILSRSIVVQWTIGICGLCVMIIAGNKVLGLLKSNSVLLPNNILFILCIVLFLEYNHSTFATVITLSNTIPFVKASLYSGLVIGIMGYLVLSITSLGILGLILVQGLVQLSYNNWYWPRFVLRKEHLTPLRIFKLAVSKNV